MFSFRKSLRFILRSRRDAAHHVNHPSRSRRMLFDQLEDRRLLALGDLDLSFGTGGVALLNYSVPISSTDVARNVIVDSVAGKITAFGFSAGPAGDQLSMSRYHLDGSLDPSFGTGGQATGALLGVANLATSIEGKVLVAGQTYHGFDAGNDGWLARYNLDGSLEWTFEAAFGLRDENFFHAIEQETVTPLPSVHP